jgi:uncharacterized protein YjdB
MRGFHRVAQFAILAALSSVMSCSSDATSVSVQDRVNSVVVDLGLSTMTVGQTVQASAIVRDVAGGALSGVTIAWISSNPSVLTVTQSGLLTAIAPGQAQIIASAAGFSGT